MKYLKKKKDFIDLNKFRNLSKEVKEPIIEDLKDLVINLFEDLDFNIPDILDAAHYHGAHKGTFGISRDVGWDFLYICEIPSEYYDQIVTILNDNIEWLSKTIGWAVDVWPRSGFIGIEPKTKLFPITINKPN